MARRLQHERPTQYPPDPVGPDLAVQGEGWPIVSLQRQLAPARSVFDCTRRCGVALDSLVSRVSRCCIVSGATVGRPVFFSNVRVAEGSLIEDSQVLSNAVAGREAFIRRAAIDKRCRLLGGFRGGFGAEIDRARGLHVTQRGITLVTPEMIGLHRHGSH